MSTLFTRAETGCRAVDVPPEVCDAALQHLRSWLESDRFADYVPQIEALVDAGRFDELIDCFRQVLPFGTGGRRGHVGVGPNRMNPHTIGTSVQGHAQWLRTQFDGSLRVVIAYDVRCFEDARGVYDAARPSPIHGLTSRDLAEYAAQIYAANDIEAHLLQRGAEPYMSTPELSFAIRHLGAHGGLNISASHNPPDDNGVKVYDDRGAQLVPPQDEALLEVVASVASARTMPAADAHEKGLARTITSDVHQAYVDLTAQAADGSGANLSILYTPLHGTGVVHESLTRAGFDCRLHAPQATLDGRFPTVPGRVANPENPEAMAHALAAATGCDLVFGTDPDADRLGCEVWHQGEWVHLTGNDIAVLVAYQGCRRARAGTRPLVIVTEVTSTLVTRVARSAGAAVVSDLLVGFKYIADGLKQLESNGTWRGVLSSEVELVAAAEESHGVLVTPHIRDKDAAGGAVMLAGLAGEAKQDGRTLVDVLQGLQHAHGLIANGQISVRFEGAAGASQMEALLGNLRTSRPTELGGRAVLAAFDHLDETGRFGPYLSGSDRSSRNVLVYHLGSDPRFPTDIGARVILRPSGTEPKLKIYVEILGRASLDATGRATVDQAMEALANAMRSRFVA